MKSAALWTQLRKKVLVSYSSSRLAVPLTIASVVGILTGLVIVGFIFMIETSQHFFTHDARASLSFLGGYGIILIPAAAGLVIGLVTYLLTPESKEQGVPEVLKAIALKGGRLPLRGILARMITSVLALASGFSVGREGPAVHIGSGIGSNVARLFRMSDMRVKNLAACGAAAGISAVFNAPITGVMFALEVILRDFGARALSTVVVSSVAASIVSRIFLGESPAFIVPVYKLWSPFEIFLYMGLGVLSAFAAVAFISVMERSDRVFEGLRMPVWLKPALGGLMIGLIGFQFPQILGMGFQAIEEMLHGRADFTLLMILVALKIISTSISLSSGSTGGTLAPTLFVGGALGGAMGHLVAGRLPFIVAPPGAYALVGMASVFAGAFHAPVTAILLVFEMTGDYHIILPLMAAAVISTSIAQTLRRESIDTYKFKQQGISLEAIEGAAVLGAMQVRDAMTADFAVVPRHTNAKELIDQMSREKEKAFFVVNSREELVGIVRPKIVQEILLEKNLALIIADDIASPVYDICFPEEPLGEAAHLMKLHHVSLLPVMSPEEPKKVIGVIRSEDVFRAYTDLAVKREELLSRMEQEGSHAEGTLHLRFTVSQRSPLAGKLIKEFGLPDGIVLTSVQRKKVTLIPEGDTRIAGKDKIWAVVLPKSEEKFQEWLKENKLK